VGPGHSSGGSNGAKSPEAGALQTILIKVFSKSSLSGVRHRNFLQLKKNQKNNQTWCKSSLHKGDSSLFKRKAGHFLKSKIITNMQN
jgi:hypothetical protein